MIFNFLTRRDPTVPTVAERIHAGLMDAARRPAFYREFGVPDTLPGRFELVVLHVALYIGRIRDAGPDAVKRGQEVLDATFSALDDSLRQIGVGDTSVPKNMKAMARAYHDGAQRYDRALAAEGDSALADELRAIVYRGVADARDGPARLAAYVRTAEAALAGASLDDLVSTGPVFPEPGEVLA